MFGKKKTITPTIEYNPELQRAVLKCSICNGERVAGFKDLKTGKFSEVMFIRNDRDLDNFMKMCNISGYYGYSRKVCDNCGYETNEDFEFCPKCGRKY